MHIVYKIVILSVVFSLVMSLPAPQNTDDESFSDAAEDIAMVADDSDSVNVAIPVLELIKFVIPLLPKLFGLKSKAITVGAAIIKWLAPKTIFLAIGAIATFAFCKLSGLCSVAYVEPAVYHYVPPQVLDYVTPERLEDAQQLLASALQQYEYSERR